MLSSLAALSVLPLLPVPKQRRNEPHSATTVILCIGESGQRVHNHLVQYIKTGAFYTIILHSDDEIPYLLDLYRENKLIIVSQLDEPLLWRLLNLVEKLGDQKKTNVTAYLIYPHRTGTDGNKNIQVNRSLRKAYVVLDYVRVVNLPEYAEGSIRPRWRLRFFDNSMTNAEKQIVWEILRNERNTIQPVKEAL
jgi:hypothetical protein